MDYWLTPFGTLITAVIEDMGVSYRKKQKVYSQGDPADSVFYVQEGKLIALHGKGYPSRKCPRAASF